MGIDIAWPPKNINKVAVFGMARSGKSALKLAQQTFPEVYAVNKGPVDEWDGPIGFPREKCFPQDAFRFEEMDLIVLSPGIPQTLPELRSAREKNIPLISEIEFAWRFAPMVPVIAITGTNGKTTTTTMVSSFLERLGNRVFCGGNIGVPYSDMVLSGSAVDYAVIEVSSFQLETIEDFHPQVALILNIFPNHSERYAAVTDYAQAKYRLLKNLTAEDTLILGEDNDYLAELPSTPARKLFFRKGSLPEAFSQKFSFQNCKLPGEHNEANFYAAYLALKSLELPELDAEFQAFIDDFSGVSHRLEFVRDWSGLRIYNDAKSTNMLATTTALRAFEAPEDLYLVLGGKIRDPKDRILPELEAFGGKVSEVLALGEACAKIVAELGETFSVTRVEDLQGLKVELEGKKRSGVLIFSPGFPSFDQFKNFEDRGEKFKTMIWELG